MSAHYIQSTGWTEATVKDYLTVQLFGMQRVSVIKDYLNTVGIGIRRSGQGMLDYLVLTLFRTPSSAVESLSPQTKVQLSDAERAGWQWLAVQGRAKSTEYAEALKVDDRTARRHLNRFVSLGLAGKSGSARATVYKVLQKGRSR